jgi:bisphosphoglycerate-independent phosphoglycerate mutase (AlkP superfamily)
MVMNIANADMLGHTGDLSATRLAIEAIDTALVQYCKTPPLANDDHSGSWQC